VASPTTHDILRRLICGNPAPKVSIQWALVGGLPREPIRLVSDRTQPPKCLYSDYKQSFTLAIGALYAMVTHLVQPEIKTGASSSQRG
jgi:hypothetical protein